MQASVTSAQKGCSPWWLRCSDQFMLTVVRVAAISRASPVMRDAGDLLRPRCVLAGERGRELLEAHGAAVEKGAVVQPFGQERVAERQNQRGVGVGPDRQPFDVAAGVEIVGSRRNIDETHALGAHGVEPAFNMMFGRAARV